MQGAERSARHMPEVQVWRLLEGGRCQLCCFDDLAAQCFNVVDPAAYPESLRGTEAVPAGPN